MSTAKQEQLENLTKPEEGQTVNGDLKTVDNGKDDKDEQEQHKMKQKQQKQDTKKKETATPVKTDPVEDLLKEYKERINKGDSEAKSEDTEFTGGQLEKALGFEDLEITDEQMIKDQTEYQKRRTAYFRIENKNEWHKIPIFDHYDKNGNAIYKIKLYKFYDYPYEVREVIDKVRADYEDLNRQKTMWDILRMIRDPTARVVASSFVKAQHKWIDVGRTFLLHMQDADFKKAHKDYILLMVDTAMYRQETFIPNLRVKSKDTSAESESTTEDSQQPSGIQ